MTLVAHISAQMLRDGRRTIAERLISRLEASASSGEAVSENAPFGKLSATSADRSWRIEQLETHLQTLAACIRFRSPALLGDYTKWMRSQSRNVYPGGEGFLRFLSTLTRFFRDQFPTDVSTVIESHVETAIRIVDAEPTGDSPPAASHPDEDLQRDYLAALLGTRRREALQLIVGAVEAGTAIESIYLDVLQPAQVELGRLWQTGRINVAQEHYCTAATQFVMSQIQPYFLTDQAAGNTLVATCVGDELHEVGLRILADLFEIRGWNTIYLGANAPAESIAQAIVANSARVLAISTTMTRHLFGVEEVIRLVRSFPGCEHVQLMVGGYPFLIDPYLWKRVGADATATDAREAIRVASQLAESGSRKERAAAIPAVQPPADSPPRKEPETDNDLSRLNNSLITLQRELNKANVQLAALNRANEEKAEALQLADRRKDEFLSMLAHELRGPLAPMELAVSLLQMDDLDPSIVAQARDTMKRQLRQMSHLISDLLDASRIVHGKIELQLETLDLAEVIQRAIEIAHPLIQDRDQELTVDLSASPIHLRGDEIRLTQVFANLLTNASKYTHPGGSLWLTTRRMRDTAVIEVRDNGVGIDAELLPYVFSSFTQSQRSKQLSMGGLGLGLSLVSQLTELHQGTVAAESEGEDRGSIFTVTLPALESLEESIRPLATDSGPMFAEPGTARRVLIVEDSAGIARITAVLFEQLGHVPDIAHDGATAIQKFAESVPEIIVLDLELPDMSGLEVTRQIRQLDQENRALIVALTGHDDDRHRRLAEEHGCDVYLVKPVDVRSLQELTTHAKLMTANGSH
ncbi:MAG: response regulator [Planctomycetaceae bacterium]|nr:response regulator [Planctomycetaceae bacterium]